MRQRQGWVEGCVDCIAHALTAGLELGGATCRIAHAQLRTASASTVVRAGRMERLPRYHGRGLPDGAAPAGAVGGGGRREGGSGRRPPRAARAAPLRSGRVLGAAGPESGRARPLRAVQPGAVLGAAGGRGGVVELADDAVRGGGRACTPICARALSLPRGPFPALPARLPAAT